MTRSWQTYVRDGRGVFRRHWKLLVLPIPVALLITIWVVVSTPTMYQSQAAMWSNITSAQAAQSAQAANGQTALTPAAAQQALLNELLATDSFRSAVATTSPLAAWLKANPPSKLTPSGLTGLLHGTPPLSERIRTALLSGTSTTVNGPQVMTISFQAQSPTVARETLSALLTTFAAQRTALAAQSQGTLQVLDPPSTPAGPTSGAAKSLTTLLIGLLAGVAVTIAAVAMLVWLKERKRRAAASGDSGADRSRHAEDGVVVPAAAQTVRTTSAGEHINGTSSAPGDDAVDDESVVAISRDGALREPEGSESEAAGDVTRRAAPREPAREAPPVPAGEDTRITGTVRDVRVVRDGESRRVVWVVGTSPGTPAIARRTHVAIGAAPGGVGTVRRVETTPQGVDVYVEFPSAGTSGDRDDAPDAADRAWVGHDVTISTGPAAPTARVARRSRA